VAVHIYVHVFMCVSVSICVCVSVCLLLSLKSSNITRQHNSTPLHLAAEVDSVECIAVLLKYKANINAANKVGCDVFFVSRLLDRQGVCWV
jgi:ankyrin repeat protein